MPTVLSEDEFFTGEKSADYSRGQSSPRTISTDEFLGADPLSKEALQPSLAQELFTTDPLAAMQRGLKQGAGMAAQVADMALGLPGQAIRVGANIGGRVKALALGGSASDADWAGKALADQVPRSLTNPVGAAMEALGYGKDYNENQVAHVMENVMGVVSRGGEWVEEKTGKVLTKRAVEDIFETFMLSAGGRGTAAALDPKLKAVGAPGLAEKAKIKPPKGGWRTPLDEPTLGEKPPIPGLDVTEMGPPPAGGVWQFDRAAKPVGEALDLTDEPKLPVGEAAEVPNIPTGEALELTDIPTPQVKTIGGAVGEKMVAKMRQGAVPAAVAGTGLGLAILYPDQKEEALGAAAGALAVGRGKGLTLNAIHALPEATPVKVFRDQSATTLLTLERLPENGYRFRKQTIQDQLKRQDVTKAERELIEGVMKEVEGDTVTAKELWAGVKLRTGDWELKANETQQWADYGLEAIDRQAGYDPLERVHKNSEPTTTIYDLPEGVLLPKDQVGNLNAFAEAAANHFNDPNYFAHTRSFVEGGVRHVVEIQSDLAQKAGKVLGEEERARLEAQEAGLYDQIQAYKEVAYKTSRAGDWAGGQAGLRVFKKLEPELLKLNPDAKMMLESNLLSNLPSDLYMEWQKPFFESANKAVAEEQARGVQDGPAEQRLQRLIDQTEDTSGGVIEWLLEKKDLKPNDDRFIGAQLHQIVERTRARLEVLQAEHHTKLAQSSSTSRIQPLLKDWYKRIVREELARETQPRENPAWEPAKIKAERRRFEAEDFYKRYGNGWADRLRELREAQAAAEASIPPRVLAPRQTVRFATADTVAKVEGWPTLQDRLHSNAQYYRIDSPEYRAWEAKALEAEKTGAKFFPEHQSIYDRYRGDVEKFLRGLGGKPYTDSAGHTWIEVPVEGSKDRPAGPRVQMLGGVDPKLATAVAAIGGGAALAAYLSPRENRKKNAALAAAVIGLAAFARERSPFVREWVESAGRGAENVLSVISEDIRNISPALLKRMRDHERWVMEKTHERLNTIVPFVTELRKLPEAAGARLNAALLTGDAQAIRDAIIASGSRALQTEYSKVREILNDMGRELHATGRLRKLVMKASQEYYPRIVTDLEGLLASFGKEERSVLQKMLDQAERVSNNKTGLPLTPVERSFVVGEFLKQRSSGQGRSGFLKPRSIEEVTPELARFYAPASESLPIYIRAMTKEIERAKFFGEDLVRDSETGVSNLELSIQRVVERERDRGVLDDKQIEKLRGLLASRFGPGEAAADGYIQTFRNLTNVGLLGNITSAGVQAGDLALPLAAYGLLPTARAVATTITRRPLRATVRDIGLVDHISEEVTGGVRTPLIVLGREVSSAKFVEKVFKFTGFSLVDQFGKAVSINASWDRAKRAAATPAGVAKLKARYGEAWGSDFDALVKDLRSGEMTENVKSLLFYDLSDLQPISKLEVPKAYLDHPNGRVLYQMKTYMVKQMNVLRREALGEMRKGNVRQGMTNLLRYGLALGISGATTSFIVNWMLGKDAKLEWGDIPENALKTMGWSSYVVDKARKGEPFQAIAGTVAPPWKMWDRIVTMDPSAVQYMPPLGKLYYYNAMGGAQKADAFAEKQRRLAEMPDDEYERMLEKRRLKAERAKERAQ